MEKLKIISINVRGIREKKKRMCIINWLKNKTFDVICLQETFLTEDIKDQTEKDFKILGKLFSSCSDSSHSRGVSILISQRLADIDITGIHKSSDGRKVMVNVKLPCSNTAFCFVSAYAPNKIKDRFEFIQNLSDWIDNFCTNRSQFIVAGDFNTTYREIDRASQKIDNVSVEFTNMMNYLSLFDTFVYLNPKEIQFSYINSSNNAKNSRIDYILASNDSKQSVKAASIICCPAPDHKAVTTEIYLNPNKRGKGYWKLNNSLLKDELYKNKVIQEIRNTVLEYGQVLSKQDLLELIKVKVKETSIRHSSLRNQFQKSKISQIEQDIENINKKLVYTNDQNLIDRRKKLQTELNELYKEKTEAAYIRSRAKWIEQGEKNTAFFLNLEKQHQNNNCITKLKDENGHIAQDDKSILSQIETFYTKLYTSTGPKQSDIANYLNDTNFKNTLSPNDSLSCEGLITKDECEKTLMKMNGNKSPGTDGLSVEFYKSFWCEIGNILVDSFNEAFTQNILSESRNTSIMSLIYKKGDRTDIKNYRPISLTNTDYKILAHILANRLHQVLHKIISTDQTGYIKTRYIGTNIRKILDTAEYLTKNDSSGIFLFLDFEKAFDTVEWPFLFKVLGKLNFGKEFIKWIKLLYKEPCAVLKNNGWLSDKINLKRGIKQGCPASALLFILVVEVLAIRLKESKYRGIIVESYCKSKELKLSQYADDTCLFLKDEKQIASVIQVIKNFSDLAGPKLNKSKTEGLWLGKDKVRQFGCSILNIKWPMKPIRCLGIYIGGDLEECNDLNWWTKLKNVEKILNSWKRRHLTLLGKITIIKSLIIPKIFYPLNFLDPPNGYIKNVIVSSLNLFGENKI